MNPGFQHESQPCVTTREVKFTGSTALTRGMGLCYDRDYGTAADAEGRRDRYVELPSASNAEHFAGVVINAHSAKTGGQWITIYEPGSACLVYTDQNCTVNSTILSLNTSGTWTANGTGQARALCLQTVDRSSTAGLVLALISARDWYLRPYGTAAGRGPSPAIWHTCPWDAIRANPQLGVAFFDDFLTANLPAANAAAVLEGFGQYAAYADINAAGSILSADVIGGAVSLDPDGDNEQVAIGTNGFMAAGQATYLKPFWFEARVKMSSIANTKFGVFVGLYEPGILAAEVPLVDAGTVAVKDCIGFWRNEAQGATVDTIHGLNGGAIAQVKDTAFVPVADTFYKLGMYFDGSTVYFYKDGVVLADSVDPDATNFPDEQIMGLCLAQNNAAADPGTTTIDWWRAAILY